MIAREILLALSLSTLAFGQQTQPGQLPSDARAKAREETWKAMTVKEKLTYDAHHVLDVENLVFAGIGAGFDQLRERPGEWGDGGGAYAERYASHFGYYLVQRSIFYPIQAIDHEDTRYLRSRHENPAARVGDAFLHTIWRRNDSGGMMPAYSEFLGDYGASAVSRMWWPEKYHTGSAIFIAGSDTILIDGAINVFHEFKPDLKHLLHIRP